MSYARALRRAGECNIPAVREFIFNELKKPESYRISNQQRRYLVETLLRSYLDRYNGSVDFRTVNDLRIITNLYC